MRARKNIKKRYGALYIIAVRKYNEKKTKTKKIYQELSVYFIRILFYVTSEFFAYILLYIGHI